MRTARPLGLTPDGASLLVVTSDGEQIAVVADERLRAAVRDDRARLGQLEIHMESSLRPREIQARIRAGESVDDVAQAAGMPAERVRTFAGPVLAEREHIVGLALAAPVRRRGETAATRGLRSTTTERLLVRGIDADTVTWDSWKQSDGLWTVSAAYQSGSAAHLAHFSYDPRGRFSVANDDDARWLIGETSPAHGPQPGRRKRAVDPDNEPTVDLDDELALVRATLGQEPAAGADIPEAPELPDVDVPDYTPAELEEVDGVYDLVPPKTEMDVLYDMISGIDEESVRVYTGLSAPVTQEPAPASQKKRATTPPEGAAASPDEPEQLSLMDLVDDEPTRISPRPVSTPVPAPAEPAQPGAAGDESPADNPPDTAAKPAPKRRRSKRASVPSWDEIMFGGPKS